MIRTQITPLKRVDTSEVMISHLSQWLLSPVLTVNTESIKILWEQLPLVMVLTCLTAVLAEIVPMIKLVRMDPNTILIEE